MGLLDFLFSLFGVRKKKVKIIFCGLDNSGKTTIINLLKPKKVQTQEIVPTVGFSMESFEKNNIRFTAFDMSGQAKYRSLWESFFSDVSGVVFVIDSSDRVRIGMAQSELENLVNHPAMKNIPILFFANKQDVPGAMTADEVSEKMKLHELTSRSWTLHPSNALIGEGIEQGIKWLSVEVNKVTK